MKKIYGVLCICIISIQAQVIIENRSSLPFLITGITYEHHDGIQKNIAVESVSITVSGKSNYDLSESMPNPIIRIDAVYKGKTHTFNVPGNQQFILLLTPQQQIEQFGPKGEPAEFVTEKEFNRPRLT